MQIQRQFEPLHLKSNMRSDATTSEQDNGVAVRVSSADVKGGWMGNVTESTHSTDLDNGLMLLERLKLLWARVPCLHLVQHTFSPNTAKNLPGI